MTTFKTDYVNRYFGQGETIEAVIRNINKDEDISGGLLEFLMKHFNEINNNEVPVIGKQYKIPTIKT